MHVLGVSGNFGRPEHDASAVLVRDGDVIAAAEEERFIRSKGAIGVMPDRAVQHCLAHTGISMGDVDVLAFPRSTWAGHEDRLAWWSRTTFGAVPKRIAFVDHQLCHAASAALTSPFDDALCVTFDMSGDGISAAAYTWERSEGFDEVDAYRFPRSLGMAYVAVTQFLGFRGTEEEGKVMALAQTGTPSYDLGAWIRIDADGFDVDPDMFHPEVFKRYPEFHTRQLPYFSDAWEAAFPFRRLPGGVISSEHRDLAASLQATIEAAAERFVSARLVRTGRSNLCLAGGVVANSVLNGHLWRSVDVDDISIPSAPGDAGSALGAALYAASEEGHAVATLRSARLGPGPAVEKVIGRALRGGFEVRRLTHAAMVEEAARRVASGEVLGLVQGRMEFGPRALGGRSLVCHPNHERAFERLTAIKSRSPYRPFGPSVTEESFHRLAPGHPDSPFMSYTIEIDDHARSLLANAVAGDGTTRAQALRPEDGLIHALASSSGPTAGIEAVVNTSLNTDGMPIDLDGTFALGLLASSDLDAICLDDVLIHKSARP